MGRQFASIGGGGGGLPFLNTAGLADVSLNMSLAGYSLGKGDKSCVKIDTNATSTSLYLGYDDEGANTWWVNHIHLTASTSFFTADKLLGLGFLDVANGKIHVIAYEASPLRALYNVIDTTTGEVSRPKTSPTTLTTSISTNVSQYGAYTLNGNILKISSVFTTLEVDITTGVITETANVKRGYPEGTARLVSATTLDGRQTLTFNANQSSTSSFPSYTWTMTADTTLYFASKPIYFFEFGNHAYITDSTGKETKERPMLLADYYDAIDNLFKDNGIELVAYRGE